ncbi:DUF4440 domain-containing protein [Qipengyuania aquimaris]|uniref:DUF4440 domain-containing protein n=1 Tax=Qipengyuania aquimaris TaxID=255984 RepID=A0A9Q3S2J9_9SPHN|nr:DUF4440 domain-containing protein [Qipengyuania aquimaris]MBY6218896.1 DUF4440 domain-containing protein [Qipengyuania aquimaris]UOR15944.1 DUF4440 domain-containing protein [Qipengyuania aquimaris]
MSALAAILLAQAAPAVAEVPVPMPVGEEMTARIEANDAKLFWGFFEACDPDMVAPMLHPDFRMIHDLVGLPASSAEEFIGQARTNCDSRKSGQPNEGYKNRRLLVPGSRTIGKLGEWGALEEAYHTFHEWRGEEIGWVQTGGARYLHIWQWMPGEGRFRLLESLSLDHGPAPQYPPATE